MLKTSKPQNLKTRNHQLTGCCGSTSLERLELGKKENVLQAAITGALEVHCDRPGGPLLELFPPYAVQQGATLRKFCADLVGRLNDAQVILLEIKELDCCSGKFPAYDLEQHEANLQFERLGVPLGYAYNAIWPLSYYARPRPDDWPALTLAEVKRSLPSKLPNKTPNVLAHPTLLEWLQDLKGQDVSEELGRIHGAVKGTSRLRNGTLVLLHAVEENVLTSLSAGQLDEVMKCLNRGSWLSPDLQERLEKVLGASTAVFTAFTKPPTKRSASRKRNDASVSDGPP